MLALSTPRMTIRVFNAVLAVAFMAPASAQSISPASIETLKLAHRLSVYGQLASDPWALFAAVRLYRASGTVPSTGSTADSVAAAQRRPPEEALLRQARRLAQDQPELLAAMDRELQGRAKSALIGPQVERLLVSASDTWSMVLRFVAGRPATFGISADKLDDLRLVVQGRDGKPLCTPALREGELLCRWQPSETSEVRIEVANLGNSVREMVFFHD